ncbi:hypothetical protein ASPFODRAFT_368708 [Aspergillus luchuensis CBS 106.47]|uniref:DUF7025 domain-containing protein n=1 Tax=Aspergillus luchuensis (strain CBS 106.47) TaxID=1137211 RepID=A0A1M3T5C4_ASPLC|nr:hypothetical protein ASPFODRAFT_368708 [Aspergillus luchuensis CBS 106.47]
MSLQENHGRLQRGLSSSVTSRYRIVEPEEIRFRRRLPGDYDSNFSDEEEQISERGNMSEGTIAVSYVIGSDGTKRVEIHSKPLVEALGRATKDSTSRGPADFFTESEPFPTLFYHIEDIREEIAKSDDEDASLDLKALERVAAEMAPLWHKARAETFESGFVSYDMLWKLFQTEEPVLHEDEIGCLWQFIFIDITYHSAQRQRRRPPKEQCAAFTVWGLKWDNVEQQLKREILIYKVPEFAGRKSITSLPLVPLRYRGERSVDEINRSLAERGRRWWKLIEARTSCLDYNGLAFSLGGERDNVYNPQKRTRVGSPQ